MACNIYFHLNHKHTLIFHKCNTSVIFNIFQVICVSELSLGIILFASPRNKLRVTQQVSGQTKIRTLACLLLVQHILLPRFKTRLVITESRGRMWLISNRWWFIENSEC